MKPIQKLKALLSQLESIDQEARDARSKPRFKRDAILELEVSRRHYNPDSTSAAENKARAAIAVLAAAEYAAESAATKEALRRLALQAEALRATLPATAARAAVDLGAYAPAMNLEAID